MPELTPYYQTFILLFTGSILAGLLGSLSGLGGGLIITPFLVYLLHVDMPLVRGLSLIAVIATSTSASSVYVKEGHTDIKAAILLETATTLGAVVGAVIGVYLFGSFLSLAFALVLLYTAISSYFANGATSNEVISSGYVLKRIPLGYFVMFISGVLSGILGIGSGALKVIALDKIMGFPFKVSTSTSNLMIGVTAAAGAGVYFRKGYIDVPLALPIFFGVVLGAFFGAKLLPKTHVKAVRNIFNGLIILIAIQMIYKVFA